MLNIPTKMANARPTGFYNFKRTIYDLTAMRSILFFLLALPFLLSSNCRPAAAPMPVSNKPAASSDRSAAKPISELSWMDADQHVQKLADLHGKAVILDFWA